MGFSSASPSCRPHHQLATLLPQKEKKICVTRGSGSWEMHAVVICSEPFLSPWGGLNQLVLSFARPTLILLPIWFRVTVVSGLKATIITPLSKYTHAHFASLLPVFHQNTFAPPVEWPVGFMPNALHFPSCSGFCSYLHRWPCRCCWRLFCTGPAQGLCGVGGRYADPTETQVKHLYQLNRLHV